MEAKAAPLSQDSIVTCRDQQGQEIQGSLLRFNRLQAIFEIYAPAAAFRMSEVLDDFKIILNGQHAYSGRAVLSSLISAGEVLVCEVTLDGQWITNEIRNGDGRPHPNFNRFLAQWQRSYQILPEFKVVVSDMRSLLSEMRLWLDKIELDIRSGPPEESNRVEQATAQELAGPILSAIDSLGDRFEEIAGRLDPDARPPHIHFARRNLHSLLLCSPFSHRTFHKPLGYAGDYEMVNMILQNPYQGASLYAKIVNAWFLNQLPARAHRNRIKFLKQKLGEEIARAMRRKRSARIFNLGCGPATEIQEFLAESRLCENASFSLLDFNEETIQYTSNALHGICRQFDLKTVIQMRKKSVQQLLKEAARADASTRGAYDFLYCAGLFDYLPDKVCKQLMDVFYQWLAPDGLLLVTNVDGTLPFRNKLEFILDWNLLYRNGAQFAELRPEKVPGENCQVKSDWTAVNVFLEIRKPHA